MSATVVSDYRTNSPAIELSSGATTTGTGVAPIGISTSRATPLPENSSRASRARKDEWKNFKVKRRLKGFVADAHGETGRVIFVEMR